MIPEYPLANVQMQMANNLFKWWRTKVLNGYKQFSVVQLDGRDGRPSDTEELLSHGTTTHSANDNCSNSCSTPPPQSRRSAPTEVPIPPPESPPQQQQQQKHLNLEEFSCDVSMEGGIYRDGQERQEFSFTLYDFDGHGKITKDDIAGLVTTIYETLGSSVKVPHYGSKTIKVKLTVSPDQRKRMSATVIDHKATEHEPSMKNGKQDENNGRDKTSHQQQHQQKQQHQHQEQKQPQHHHHHPQRQRRYYGPCRRPKYKGMDYVDDNDDDDNEIDEHTCCNYHRCKLFDGEAEYNSDHYSRISDVAAAISEDEGECSEDQILKVKPTKRYQKYTRFRNHHAHANAGVINAHVPISPVLCTKARRNKKRSSSLQRRELLEIIQANMEKNSHGHSFQISNRKQCPNSPKIEDERCQHRHKPVHHESTAHLQCLANIVNSENCYLDLTALQYNNNNNNNHHYHQLPVPDGPDMLKNLSPYYFHYDKLLGAVVCMSNKPQSCRSRQSTPFRYHLLEPHPVTTAVSLKKAHAKWKTCDMEQQTPIATATAAKRNIKKFPPQVVLGHSSSPHHMKHRNRQEDQARAMAQVVRWLEQEFSSSVRLNNHNQNNSSGNNNNNNTGKKNRSNQSPTNHHHHHHHHQHHNTTAPSPGVSAVERHEHHHVHEHVHHHYHHYQETPVVV